MCEKDAKENAPQMEPEVACHIRQSMPGLEPGIDCLIKAFDCLMKSVDSFIMAIEKWLHERNLRLLAEASKRENLYRTYAV